MARIKQKTFGNFVNLNLLLPNWLGFAKKHLETKRQTLPSPFSEGIPLTQLRPTDQFKKQENFFVKSAKAPKRSDMEEESVNAFLDLFGSEELNQFKIILKEPKLNEWLGVLIDHDQKQKENQRGSVSLREQEQIEEEIKGKLDEIECFKQKTKDFFGESRPKREEKLIETHITKETQMCFEGNEQDPEENEPGFLEFFFRPVPPQLNLKRGSFVETRDSFQSHLVSIENESIDRVPLKERVEDAQTNQQLGGIALKNEEKEKPTTEISRKITKLLKRDFEGDQIRDEISSLKTIDMKASLPNDFETAEALSLLMARWAAEIFSKSFQILLRLLKGLSGFDLALLLTLFTEGTKNYSMSIEIIHAAHAHGRRRKSQREWKCLLRIWNRNVYQPFKNELLIGFNEVYQEIRTHEKAGLAFQSQEKTPKKQNDIGVLGSSSKASSHLIYSDDFGTDLADFNAEELISNLELNPSSFDFELGSSSAMQLSPSSSDFSFIPNPEFDIGNLLGEFEENTRPELPLLVHFAQKASQEDRIRLLRLFADSLTNLGINEQSLLEISSCLDTKRISIPLFELETHFRKSSIGFFESFFQNQNANTIEQMIMKEKETLSKLFPDCFGFSILKSILNSLECFLLGKTGMKSLNTEQDILKMDSNESSNELLGSLEGETTMGSFESLQTMLASLLTNLEAHSQMTQFEIKAKGCFPHLHPEFFSKGIKEPHLEEVSSSPQKNSGFKLDEETQKSWKETQKEGFQSLYYPEFRLGGKRIDDDGFVYSL